MSWTKNECGADFCRGKVKRQPKNRNIIWGFRVSANPKVEEWKIEFYTISIRLNSIYFDDGLLFRVYGKLANTFRNSMLNSENWKSLKVIYKNFVELKESRLNLAFAEIALFANVHSFVTFTNKIQYLFTIFGKNSQSLENLHNIC